MEAKSGADCAKYLVVAENEPFARALRTKLQRWGEAAIARNYDEVVRMIRGRPYSAVFVDVCLPGGSGLDLLREFRRFHPRTPAMVLTGHFEQPHSVTACALRAQYVVKPISLAAIEAFVTQPASFDEALADTLEKWRVRYGLSDAEADVLHHAACGVSIDAIAEGRGTGKSTLVTQLGSACRKTGDHSSGRMIARVLRDVAGQPSAWGEFPVRRRSGLFAVAAQRPSPSAPLSERERDVVMRVTLGMSYKEVANDLGIAHATVRTLSRRAAAKLRIVDRGAPRKVGSKK
jgi:DNA-binding NarL/FixJ family response regulator